MNICFQQWVYKLHNYTAIVGSGSGDLLIQQHLGDVIALAIFPITLFLLLLAIAGFRDLFFFSSSILHHNETNINLSSYPYPETIPSDTITQPLLDQDQEICQSINNTCCTSTPELQLPKFQIPSDFLHILDTRESLLDGSLLSLFFLRDL